MSGSSPDKIVRKARMAAGFSQRELARRAGTSQPAIARYERATAVPSWGTLQRIAAACGRRLSINMEPLPGPHDVELVRAQLQLTPVERLRSVKGYARLRRGRRNP